MMEKSIPFPRYSSLNISILRPVSNRQKSRRNHACSVKCPRNNRMPLIFPRREENSTFQWIFRTRYSFHSSHSNPSTIPLLSLFSPLFPSISVTRDCFRIRFLPFLFSLCLSFSLSQTQFPERKRISFGFIWNKTPDVTGYTERSNKASNDPTSLDHSSLPSTV